MTAVKTSPAEIAELLSGLYDKVKVTSAPSKIEEPRVVATYANGAGIPRRALVLDLTLANGAGAALSMIAPGYAAESTKGKTIPENIRENLREVLNICVGVFAKHCTERLVLQNVFFPGDDLQGLIIPQEDAGTYTVTIDKYGTGNLHFYEI